MAEDTLGIALVNDAMGEALVIALQKLARLQKERDELVRDIIHTRAERDELVAALKTILHAWDASEDMEREINEARVLIAKTEAE